MKKSRRVLRALCLVLLILLALCGISITGNYFSAYRGKYIDREIKTEQVDKREEEDNSESGELKN